MLIIWGYRTKYQFIGFTGDDHKCFHCDAIGRQGLTKYVEQGHFFFIPMPIKRTQFFLKCPVRGCDGITELSKKQVECMHITPVESFKTSTC
jgi:hypothetical protein